MKQTQSESVPSVLEAAVVARSARLTGWFGVAPACLLMALAAQVRIPLPGTDVPVTLQSLALLIAGLTLRPFPAATAMLLYLGLGAAGLPIFAPGSQGVLGPTGGYLVGFVPAAWLIAVLKGCGEASYVRLVAAAIAGMIVVFVFGVAWRVVWLGGDGSLAVRTGLTPFAAKAGVTVMLAATLVTTTRGRRRGRTRRPGL